MLHAQGKNAILNLLSIPRDLNIIIKLPQMHKMTMLYLCTK